MGKIIMIPFLILLLTACSKKEPVDQVHLTEPELYKKSCITCHGKPSDTSINLSLSHAHKYTKEQLIDIMVNPPGGMPVIKLTDYDRERLADYIINETKP
ncbi:cytochrome c [Bacillus sp. 31A1R]|uniref:Cytochrome c n=1 Tax=Robertmurraya mangrovi TaxID=3098077 RepID=A0ABU5IVR5_9BACI|nr:cytochrome c [Bacillus sp. 31A1R]MDZ5471220.1 cytochrome c [Bacillus sp. 31A1R]